MKKVVFVLTFLSTFTFGQTVKFTEPEIEKYAKSIDKLRTENKLAKVFYPNMSACGGALNGYYLDKQLVLIDATYGAELGFSSRRFYLHQGKFLKVIYREHFAEWEKYDLKYPADKFEFDSSKMTYTDTVYSIFLASPTVFYKVSDSKVISNKLDQAVLNRLVRCGQEMKLELQEVITQTR